MTGIKNNNIEEIQKNVEAYLGAKEVSHDHIISFVLYFLSSFQELNSEAQLYILNWANEFKRRRSLVEEARKAADVMWLGQRSGICHGPAKSFLSD